MTTSELTYCHTSQYCLEENIVFGQNLEHLFISGYVDEDGQGIFRYRLEFWSQLSSLCTSSYPLAKGAGPSVM